MLKILMICAILIYVVRTEPNKNTKFPEEIPQDVKHDHFLLQAKEFALIIALQNKKLMDNLLDNYLIPKITPNSRLDFTTYKNIMTKEFLSFTHLNPSTDEDLLPYSPSIIASKFEEQKTGGREYLTKRQIKESLKSLVPYALHRVQLVLYERVGKEVAGKAFKEYVTSYTAYALEVAGGLGGEGELGEYLNSIVEEIYYKPIMAIFDWDKKGLNFEQFDTFLGILVFEFLGKKIPDEGQRKEMFGKADEDGNGRLQSKEEVVLGGIEIINYIILFDAL